MTELLEWTTSGWGVLRSLPVLLILLFAAPLAALAMWRRVFPHTLLLIFMFVPCLLSFALLAWSDAFLLLAAADAAIFLVAVLDLASVPGAGAFSVERRVVRVASLRKGHQVSLAISNHTHGRLAVWVRDGVPQEFDAAPEQFSLRLPPRSRSTMHYQFRSRRRGAFRLKTVHVRARSQLGFWRRYFSYHAPSVVHVYPDMKQLTEYALLARTNRLSLLGVRRTRKIGQDNEFERLRDYTLDDNYKHIDWRATARRNKLTVKDFQTSQSQRLVFLLDCGRMMTNEASGLSLLDHSLNAALMLSFVALRQNDSVGLICFSDQVHTYVPPRGGMNQMNQLLHASFDRFPRLVESRYDQAFLHLASHCKKRALVILISNLVDEVNANQVERYLSTLVGRHLPLGVLLRDHRLFDAADAASPRETQLYRAAAAAEILTWRRQVLTDLEHKGVLSLDVFPEDMTAPLVNQYLEIKARHLL